ncbi:Uncharacterised protein [Burkholderia pseudomallei]|nr:hypothetical protein DO72_2712 [Burkholderia pseudomallei]CAJ5820384.1 Uncharacterised protein [Burkholderia pseudomallei]CAJ6472986.1 Uncharacterised protein [Burkholderia pseudomallei]
MRAARSIFVTFTRASGSATAGVFAFGSAIFSDFRPSSLSLTCASSGVFDQSAFAFTDVLSTPSSTRAELAPARYGCTAGSASASMASFVSACRAARLNAPSAFSEPPLATSAASV